MCFEEYPFAARDKTKSQSNADGRFRDIEDIERVLQLSQLFSLNLGVSGRKGEDDPLFSPTAAQ